MRISYLWLQSYFKTSLPQPSKLAELLTIHSFEIENMQTVQDDTVFEIKTLPNRAHDCLGHIGVAKDIGLLLDLPLARESLLTGVGAWPASEKLSVHIEDAKLCRRYSGLVIENVAVGPSPDWLTKRLEAIGQKSINNVVDATNFVMFDLGQPLHAFDRAKLGEKNGMTAITVRTATLKEVIKTLGGKDYKLSSDMLVIADGASGAPIGIAGVKGGMAAEITKDTKNIILESANFDPVSIRRTAQVLGLRSDASVRFEHDLSPELTYPGLVAVAELILKIAGGKETRVEGLMDEYPNPIERAPVSVTLRQIQRLLGEKILAARAEGILRSLSAGFEEEQGTYRVMPPFERLDIAIKEDLIEEVGRVYGYEHINAQPLQKIARVQTKNARVLVVWRIREVLAALGFFEVYTYTFTAEGSVALENPIAADKKFLRKSLTHGLRKSLDLNVYHAPLLGVDVVKIFEIGTVFHKDGERCVLGIAARTTGSKKGAADEKIMQETQEALSKQFGIPFEGTVMHGILEIDFDDVVSKMKLDPDDIFEERDRKTNITYKKISPYPFMARDIALFVPVGVSPEEAWKIIEKESGMLLIRLRLFDTYEKEGKVSYAFRLVFQSDERTLTDTEIGQVMERITAVLENEREWQVR